LFRRSAFLDRFIFKLVKPALPTYDPESKRAPSRCDPRNWEILVPPNGRYAVPDSTRSPQTRAGHINLQLGAVRRLAYEARGKFIDSRFSRILPAYKKKSPRKHRQAVDYYSMM
jgi:hypothetical protein